MAAFDSDGKLLYLDILNYSTEFLLLHDWNCTRALARMDAFVNAAQNSGWSLKAFIDATSTSEEAKHKWRSRRAKEVKSGSKNVPHGSTILLGDMLRKCGVEVCYSFEADNDDTLAFHAHADGACILSHDKDMFRYVGATFTVYSDYTIKNGRLNLTAHYLHDNKGRRESSPRAIGPPPAILSEMHHVQDGVYLRGVPTPLVKALGVNPHSVVAPLRHAMYAKLNLSGPIVEEWPEWCAESNDVKWVVRTDVQPASTPELEEFLSNPDEAVKHFFPVEVAQPVFPPSRAISKADWRKHVFCVRSVVYEICTVSDPSGPSLLDLMLSHEAQRSVDAFAGDAGGEEIKEQPSSWRGQDAKLIDGRSNGHLGRSGCRSGGRYGGRSGTHSGGRSGGRFRERRSAGEDGEERSSARGDNEFAQANSRRIGSAGTSSYSSSRQPDQWSRGSGTQQSQLQGSGHPSKGWVEREPYNTRSRSHAGRGWGGSSSGGGGGMTGAAALNPDTVHARPSSGASQQYQQWRSNNPCSAPTGRALVEAGTTSSNDGRHNTTTVTPPAATATPTTESFNSGSKYHGWY